MSDKTELPPTYQQYCLEDQLRNLRTFVDSSVLEMPALAHPCHDQVRAQLQQARQLIEEAYQKAMATGFLNLPEHKRPAEGFVFI